MANPTTNYGWTLPVVDGSVNVWGELLNAAFQDIDDDLDAAETTADAAMPRSGGGTFSGGAIIFGGTCAVRENAVTVTTDLDWSAGNFFTIANPFSLSLTMSGYPGNPIVQFITIELTRAGSQITWPNEVQWQDGVAPTFATGSGEKDIVVMYTRDGGTTVIAAHSISNPS